MVCYDPRASEVNKLTEQMATLAVHEAMGSKVDREAVATLVLPQLWSMSMGPCKSILLWYLRSEADDSVLNADQFAKFMR
jgi:SCY1-like protein 2